MTADSHRSAPRFCTDCGTKLLLDALFCHNCGAPVDKTSAGAGQTPALSPLLKWGLPVAAVAALMVLTFFRLGSRSPSGQAIGSVPLEANAVRPPDISSMSPAERANRLFNRVMSLSSEGKRDSAAFFAPMAMAAFESLAPLDAHARYDLGLIALVTGDVAKAAAQSDTILRERPTHLLGLALAARAADARGDANAARAARDRLVAAESAERASALPEYTDHDADLRAVLDSARRR